jgi:hypothetical protein
VPQAQWDDPRYDPSSLQYDDTPRGEHGYVGTVNPDELLSTSGLTRSGRLIDPNVIPPKLQPYIDNGVVINDDGVLRLRDSVDVTFTLNHPNHDAAEFFRQGDLQERSLNQQSIGDWEERINNYDANGRDTGPSQGDYRAQQIQLRADALEARTWLTPDAALAQSKKEATGMDVLHGPDQYPGGNPRQFTGLGDAGVNRSYGRGWGKGGNRDRLLVAMDTILARSGIPDDLPGDIRLNVNIKVLVARS